MKLSRILRKVWPGMALITLVIPTNSINAETRIGNGGIGLQSSRGTILLDTLERGEHMVVNNEDAYQNYLKPRLNDLALSLPKTAEFLRSIFEDRQSSWNGRLTPRWYKVSNPLWRSHDRGPTPMILTQAREVQVALHTGDEIFVRNDILSGWSPRDAAMLFLHEGLITAITVEGSYLEDTEVVRKLTGRIIHPEVLQADPESLALEFLRILNRHQHSPLYEVVRDDRRNVRSVTTVAANPAEFVAKCTESYSGDSIARTYSKLIFESLNDEEIESHQLLTALEKNLIDAKAKIDELNGEIIYWERYIKIKTYKTLDFIWEKKWENIDQRDRLLKTIESIKEQIESVRHNLAPYLERNRDNCERAFRKFWQMSTIDLSGQDLEDISALAFFTEVDHINITNNKIRDLTPLSTITALRSLDASQNKIEHVAALVQMERLRVLNLGHNFIVSLDGINFPSVVDLKLHGNFLTSLNGFDAPEVRHLDLSHNKLTSGDFEYLDEIKFSKLRNVDASYNRVEDLFFVSENWETLNVGGNEVKDLSGLPSEGRLIRLDMSHTELQSLNSEDLPPKLEDLSVAGTAIKKLRIDGRFPALETLDISNSSISVSVDKDRSDRPLRTLNVSSNRAFDSKVLKYSFFSWLFDLNVSDTDMKINDYKDLWHLFELRNLELSGFEDEGELNTLKQKILVNLIKPHASKAIPGEMVSLNLNFSKKTPAETN